MRTLHTVAELREALAPHRRAGRRIGLVPTMGAFHEGHLALLHRAREDAAVVVVSLFVNPTQFRPGEDLGAYPRDEAADAAQAAALGVDVLFAPPAEEIYPPGFSTEVRVGGVTEPLEGATRGADHFHGVTTVVTKLFNIVGPDVAYFGQKDAQQAAVIRKLVRDLDIPVRIEICPTVREGDGLPSPAATATSRAPTATVPWRCRGRCAPPRTRCRAANATRPKSSPGLAPRSPSTASSPSTWSSSPPKRWLRWTGSATPTCSSPSPPGWGWRDSSTTRSCSRPAALKGYSTKEAVARCSAPCSSPRSTGNGDRVTCTTSA